MSALYSKSSNYRFEILIMRVIQKSNECKSVLCPVEKQAQAIDCSNGGSG